jgi:hypothetical protein
VYGGSITHVAGDARLISPQLWKPTQRAGVQSIPQLVKQ